MDNENTTLHTCCFFGHRKINETKDLKDTLYRHKEETYYQYTPLTSIFCTTFYSHNRLFRIKKQSNRVHSDFCFVFLFDRMVIAGVNRQSRRGNLCNTAVFCQYRAKAITTAIVYSVPTTARNVSIVP